MALSSSLMAVSILGCLAASVSLSCCTKIKAIVLRNIEVVDAEGLSVVPGLIDNHVHIAGAGGEGGPSTRTPELTLSRQLYLNLNFCPGRYILN